MLYIRIDTIDKFIQNKHTESLYLLVWHTGNLSPTNQETSVKTQYKRTDIHLYYWRKYR